MKIFENIKNMMAAHYPIMYLQSYEHRRIVDKLLVLSQHEINFPEGKRYEFYKWDIVNGLQQYDFETYQYNPCGNDNISPENALIDIRSIAEEGNPYQIFVIEDYHEYIDIPEIKVRLRHLSEYLKVSSGYKHIFILSSVLILPKELEKYITIINISLPNEFDLGTVLDNLISDINQSVDIDKRISLIEDTRNDLISAALGMTVMEAELAFSLAFIEGKGLSKESSSIISREKKQIIKKSGFLEYYDVPPNFHTTIGGLENLKNWLLKRGTAFSSAAKKFGLKEPKGVLFTGVPGCGKSLTAKAVSSMWKMPLLRFDIGKVFEAEVGSSENNIRKALDIAEAVAPSILWIDEIEKGLSGLKSSGQTDGGTSSRVFGTLLTWMQEKNRPVFVVATSNDIDQLPPELLRKGRFDSIFYVDLPNLEERKAIFNVHIKRALKTEKISDKDFNVRMLAERTKGFNGAEIEETVKEAMFNAFLSQVDNKPILGMKHIIDAIKIIDKSILARVMRGKIEFDRTRARSRFMMASPSEPEMLKEILNDEKEDIRTKEEKRSTLREWSV